MPVLATTAYNTVEDVLNLVRAIIDDSEVQGGDVLTDTAPFTFPLINAAFRRVQIELASVGVETMTDYVWLVGLPIVATIDPEARLEVNDTGTSIIYPNAIGNVFSLVPQLPVNLVLPLKLWERQSNTSGFAVPMKQPNGGISNMAQQTFLVDWEWTGDSILFRGAQQVQDVKIKMEKALSPVAAPTDPVPIRGVVNMAAYYAAKIFIESRGGAVAPQFKATADEEFFLYKQISARRRSRKQVRRAPYSGRDRQRQSPI